MPEENGIQICRLCQLNLPRHPIIDGAFRFCCSGCQAVYSILSIKGEQDDYQTHPLFRKALHFGLISNPLLLQQLLAKSNTLSDHEMHKIHFEIGEMWCPSCAEVIRLVLLQAKGIKSCLVDYATDLAVVEFSPKLTSQDKIFENISALGYLPQTFEDRGSKAVSKGLYLRFIVAAFCSLNVMMFAYPLYASYFDYDQQGMGELFAWLSFALSLPVVTYAAWPIFRRFFCSFVVGIYGMEALVTLGVLAAFGLSTYELGQGGTRVYFDSMCVIVTFILLGKIIESKAKFSAKESLFHLNRTLPKRGRKVLDDGTHLYASVKDLQLGDLLQVNMGETIVLDGIVVQGEGSCNESLMTGEARLVPKSSGSNVLGGSLLQLGNLIVKVKSIGCESTLQRIVEMIEQDIGRKTGYVRAADALARWFVPSVLLTAMGTGLYCWIFGVSDADQTPLLTGTLRAITVLLISCPCALGIAAPLAEAYLLQALTSLGAIVRNRGVLQFLGRETTIAFDKTGTITEGRFELIDGLEELTEKDRALIAGLVAKSNHPIATALAAAVHGESAAFDVVTEVAGKGLMGQIGEDLFLLGSSNFLSAHGISMDELPEEKLTTVITTTYFAKKGCCPIKLSLGDRLRKDAAETLAQMPSCRTILLSGDGELCVNFVAHSCGFSQYLSQATPLDKREKIVALKEAGEVICMVGDGINDAPALTAAHIGISVVTAADISIQVSDILLTGEHLSVIPKMRRLAVKGRGIIRQNLFWAFFYNVLGIGLAAAGLLSPIFAAFAMVTSSLIVLFNAKRLV